MIDCSFPLQQEATLRTVGQFDAAVLEIDAEEAEQVAAVEEAMCRLRVSFRLMLQTPIPSQYYNRTLS